MKDAEVTTDQARKYVARHSGEDKEHALDSFEFYLRCGRSPAEAAELALYRVDDE